MAEELHITSTNKEGIYLELIPQLEALIQGEPNLIANMANISSLLHMAFHHLWIGFYLVDNQETLVLGPFQGPIACTRIRKGKGVCGTAWQNAAPIIVPDVNKFEGHIACSSASVSEIVLPIFNKHHEVLAILDIDSIHYNTFDAIDQKYLSQICTAITNSL